VVFLCLEEEKRKAKSKKRGQVFTFASSLTLFDKVKDTHFIMHSVS